MYMYPSHWGEGIAQWLEHWTLWLKGCGFESLQEWKENFLLWGQLSVLTLILVSVPPPPPTPHITAVARNDPCHSTKSAGAHGRLQLNMLAYTLRMWLCLKCQVTWCMVVWRTQNLHWNGSSFMWHQPCQRYKYTTIKSVYDPWLHALTTKYNTKLAHYAKFRLRSNLQSIGIGN